MRSSKKRAIIAWCLYDWACSSYSIIVTTFIFATYFTTKIAENDIIGTYQWANATSIAGIIIALTSPLVGAIADHGGHHKRWLFFFTAMSIICSALLWFAYPNINAVYFTLSCVVIGTVGLEIASVFYNSFLVELAPENYLGRISGWGWGSGYFGGIVALTLALVVFIQNNFFNLDTQTAAQIRIAGPYVALWYTVFAIPLFLFVPGVPAKKNSMRTAIYRGCKELVATLKKLPQEKNILTYLIAHMIYADGLNTLFVFGGIYAAGTFGMSFEEVLLFGISMNIAAGIGAVILGWMDDYLGSKITILVSLVSLDIFGLPLLLTHDKTLFWAVGLLLCLFVGPVQSASRSMMVRLLANGEKSAEMFGLYALSGRITAFIGPWFFGISTLYFGSQRVGVASVLIFFAIGALLLLMVKVKK